MPTTEEKLKELILSTYGSVRKFSMTLDMPYSTIDTIFKRGIENSSLENVMRICDALSLSVDELAAGRLIERNIHNHSNEEDELIHLFRKLNKEGCAYILQTVRMASENPAMQKDDHNSVAV